MDRIKLKKRKKMKPLPEDIYPAKLIKVIEVKGKYGPGVQFSFKPLVKKYLDKIATAVGWKAVDDEGEAYVDIGGVLHKQLTILNKGDSDIEDLDPKDLVGAKCRIDVAHTEPDDNNNVYANVIRILPHKSAAVDDEDDEDEDEEDEPVKKKKKHFDEDDEDEETPKKKKKHHDEDDDDEDEKPSKKKRKDDEDEDDDFDEEELSSKKKKLKDKTKKKHDDDDDIFSEDDDDF